jgi:hypothetical protein
MRAVKTVKVIAAVLIGSFLSVAHLALAQGPDEATALNQQVIKSVEERAPLSRCPSSEQPRDDGYHRSHDCST